MTPGVTFVLVLIVILAVFVAVVFGVVWATGGFMTRACDEIERRPITVRGGATTILADVCVGAWQ